MQVSVHTDEMSSQASSDLDSSLSRSGIEDVRNDGPTTPHTPNGILPKEHISNGDLTKEHTSRGELTKEHTSRGELTKEHTSNGDLTKEHTSNGDLTKEHTSRGDLTKEHTSRGELTKEHTSNGDLTKEQTSDTNSGPNTKEISSTITVTSNLFNTDPSMLENHLVYQKNPFENQHFFTVNDTMRNRLHKYATTRLLPAYTYSPWYGESGSPQRRAHTVGVRSHRTYRSAYLPRHIDLTWEGFGRKKDACISFFDIETEKVSSYQYRPGEVVKGSINLIVNQNLEIRYMELVVTGKGHYSVKRSTNGLPVQGKESYLHKQTYVIGTGEVTRRSMLTPGHYTSRFCIKLPKDLPSSIRHADVKNGFSFDILYSLKARLFDDATGSSVARAASPRMLKVLMAKQVYFNVQRGFDLSLIPDVMTPITHTEKVYLSCNTGTAAKVTVHLERGVFLAGDDVRLQLLLQLHKSQAVKNIVCTLQEHVTLNPKQEPVTFKLHQMSLQDFRDLGRPNETVKRTSHDVTKTTYDVIVPTSTSILSAFSLGASQVKVTHSLSIKLRFTPVGGKLSFKIPVVIGPCAEPIYAEKSSTRKLIPIFNKPTRFPTFTQPALAPVQPQVESTATAKVTSRYTHSCLAQCLSCCLWPR